MNEDAKRKTNLKALRERANLSQRQLGELIQVTERNLYDWETGNTFPRLDRAVALARALNVSMKELCIALGLSMEGIPDDSRDAEFEDLALGLYQMLKARFEPRGGDRPGGENDVN